MSTPTTQTTIEVLDAAACWALLSMQSVGRVGYIVDSQPMIVPINFKVIGERLVFRTDPGDKLTWIPQQNVCLEADRSDDPLHGWSVVVHGLARDVTTALNSEYEDIRRTVVPTSASLHDPRWIAIDVESISGRRLSQLVLPTRGSGTELEVAS
ncbi:MAG: pyridoxamine 5-phosphate oxidase family protein [Acidimicrobiales bacterium]|nr:pyridoxamine 5-phosphate oxidase family protein [Acidimicrobiales bacterium]